MPLYTYRCPVCEFSLEVLVTSNGKPPWCPKCSNFMDRCLSKITVVSTEHHTAEKTSSTPIEDTKGVCNRFAHIADRNTGKSLGYIPAGAITEP